MSTEYQRTWENRRKQSRSVSDESRDSYYGVAPIRKAHWKWMIVFYFFLGGISGASYAIANFVNWLGGSGDQRIIRTGRYLSFIMIIPSTILLIADLKKPSRFLYMLRILKLRSPMSVGSWGLTFFGIFTGVSAVIQAAEDGLLRWTGPINRLVLLLPAKAIGTVGGVFGFFVAGYTGVLLSATAVPLWFKNALLLGPLFLSSALTIGASAGSGYFVWAQAFKVKAWCFWCLMSAGINLVLLPLALPDGRRALRRLRQAGLDALL